MSERKDWKMDRKKRKKIQKGIRLGIQIFFLFTAPAVFTSAFAGARYIFTQFAVGEIIEWNGFLKTFAAIGLFTIVFGRFFCGYACAFGTLGDILFMISSGIQKKIKKKLPKMPETVSRVLHKLKYVILAGSLLCCLLGIYEKFRGSSPWDVFSMLTGMQLPGRQYFVGVIILLFIMAGMAWEERFFCKYLCPMGGIFSLLPMLPVSLYRRKRENCLPGCSACERQCPVHLKIDGDSADSGECIQCNQCLENCPKENIATGLGKIKGNEIWWLFGKAALLFLLCMVLNLTRW